MATTVPTGTLITPGGDQGPAGPTLGVSTDPYNLVRLGSDNKLWSPSQRYNAIGNPNFEVDQRAVGSGTLANAGFGCDRWALFFSGTGVGGSLASNQLLITTPDTGFPISRNYLRFYFSTQKTTLAAGDYLLVRQTLESIQWRELANNPHSFSFLVRSSVAVKFGLTLRVIAGTFYSLTKLVTITTPSVWTIVQLPNLPVWPAGGTYPTAPGVATYDITFCLASGTTNTTSANDSWVTPAGVGAVGQDNFLANPVNSAFDIAFVQHEPGPICTQLIDKPFSQNYDECLRYYQKSYDYTNPVGTNASAGGCLYYTANQSFTGIYTPIRFHKPMAKVPTVTPYSVTGAINCVRNLSTSADVSGAVANAVGTTGFSSVYVGTAIAATQQVGLHYTADTGW